MEKPLHYPPPSAPVIAAADVLPPIPVKRYFTIGEVANLCGVKPHVLRYWEQEFTQLRPMKRRGNRRYYQHHEVLMVRRIRELLYDQGFTISGARNKLQTPRSNNDDYRASEHLVFDAPVDAPIGAGAQPDLHGISTGTAESGFNPAQGETFAIALPATPALNALHSELLALRALLVC